MKSLGELFQSTYALLFPFHTLTLSSVSTKCSTKTGIYFFFVPRILPGTYSKNIAWYILIINYSWSKTFGKALGKECQTRP